MANRRGFLYLTRQITSSLSSSGRSLQSLKTLFPILPKITTQNPNHQPNFCNRRPNCYPLHTPARRFCSTMSDESGNDEEEDDDDEDGEGVDYESDTAANCGGLKGEYTAEEREEGAAAIGYKVIGPLDQSDRVFKPYEPVFAVVQIGSHQFKVSNGDSIYTERLKFCEVNDKLILNKVLMLGSAAQTIIGRPILPNAAVHAVVEEHVLDAKVIIFKKKRRKNYRRTKGHRQELTKLRITDIQGIEKPEIRASGDSEKVAADKKPEKEKVAFPAYKKKPEKVALPA